MGEAWCRSVGIGRVLSNRRYGSPAPTLTRGVFLRRVRLFRFLLPDKELKVAGGREVCLRDLQSWIFFAGASSTMIGNYLTTTGRPAEQDWQMLKDLELTVGGYCE